MAVEGAGQSACPTGPEPCMVVGWSARADAGPARFAELLTPEVSGRTSGCPAPGESGMGSRSESGAGSTAGESAASNWHDGVRAADVARGSGIGCGVALPKACMGLPRGSIGRGEGMESNARNPQETGGGHASRSGGGPGLAGRSRRRGVPTNGGTRWAKGMGLWFE